MKVSLKSKSQSSKKSLQLVPAYSNGKKVQLDVSDKIENKKLTSSNFLAEYKAKLGENLYVNTDEHRYLILGLGEQKKIESEKLRRSFSKSIKSIKSEDIEIDFDGFSKKLGVDKTLDIFLESLYLSNYTFNKYKTKATEKNVTYVFNSKKVTKAKFDKLNDKNQSISSSVNVCRDYVNEAPNYLNSEVYADLIEKDIKKNVKGKRVKVKILKRSEIKKEKMNLFLSVNSGSAYEPRLVHLTYTPQKATKNTKHIALVGKGITFDTGGYSLKPSASMMGMKFDMGGSATLYGAFRSAVLQESKNKITCILAMTDNNVNSKATTPDSIVKGRNGKTVEILNTDAEGRLILADALDYACDLKPNAIIDAATLTGACLVAFGTEVCAILGNDQKLIDSIMKSSKNVNEYLWQLPIIDEYRDHMKSKIADLKNIGKGRMAGTATAAAFLENFIKNDISWAHLDIAGVCDSQTHLPYCPSSGASGIMVRTVSDYLMN